MDLFDVPYCCGGNGILEYVTREAVATDTDMEFCDPEWIETKEYLCLSVEQTRNSRELEQPGSAQDIIYMRGRMIKPKHKKELCLVQDEMCFKFQVSPFVDAIGIARVLPEVSSRMNLERIFNTHIQLEVKVDRYQQNSTRF